MLRRSAVWISGLVILLGVLACELQPAAEKHNEPEPQPSVEALIESQPQPDTMPNDEMQDTVPLEAVEEQEPLPDIDQQATEIGVNAALDEITQTTIQLSTANNMDLPQELYFSHGGAGGECYNTYAKAECDLQNSSGDILLQQSGVLRLSNQDKEVLDGLLWWGYRIEECLTEVEYGDMVNFIARGYEFGQEVEFELTGPKKMERFRADVIELDLKHKVT